MVDCGLVGSPNAVSETAVGDRPDAVGDLAKGALHATGVEPFPRGGRRHRASSVGGDVACPFDALRGGFAGFVLQPFAARSEQPVFSVGRRYRGRDKCADCGADACYQKRVVVDEIRHCVAGGRRRAESAVLEGLCGLRRPLPETVGAGFCLGCEVAGCFRGVPRGTGHGVAGVMERGESRVGQGASGGGNRILRPFHPIAGPGDPVFKIRPDRRRKIGSLLRALPDRFIDLSFNVAGRLPAATACEEQPRSDQPERRRKGAEKSERGIGHGRGDRCHLERDFLWPCAAANRPGFRAPGAHSP